MFTNLNNTFWGISEIYRSDFNIRHYDGSRYSSILMHLCMTILIGTNSDGYQDLTVFYWLSEEIKFHTSFHLINSFLFIRFVCQFNIEGRVTSVNAQLLGDVIYCDEMEFAYTSR